MSRFLTRLSIRSKLIIAFVGFSVFPMLLLGVYGIYSNTSMLKNIALENLTHDVYTVRQRAQNLLAGVESDIHLLQHSRGMNELTAAVEEQSQRSIDSSRFRLIPELLAFVRTKDVYYRISVITAERDELIRIECRNIMDSATDYRSSLPGDRPESAWSLYFLLARQLGVDQIAVAPAELTYQEGKQVPVVNFIMPLENHGHRVAILVASIFAGNLFQVMQTQRNLGADEKIVLVNSEGHYLYHSDLKNNWDKLIALREQENLGRSYPPAVQQAILSGNEGLIDKSIEDIIAYAPLFSSRIVKQGLEATSTFSESLFLFESVPAATVMQPARVFAWTFAGILVLFLFAAILLGIVATTKFTRPIAVVQRGAEIITQGNYAHRLAVNTGDEIERLAEQFNSMATSLEEHEQAIARHRTELENTVLFRTKELVDEKGKLQAILDNVSNAFVLLNHEGRIQTASQAFTAITGLRLDDVRGRDCREVFATNGVCRQTSTTAKAGTVETHLDHGVDPGGGERFLEHTTIPLVNTADGNSFVVILTDVTKRKRLEEQLIQSEKLMASGEMAAIIAHEFRNALTSIKMILQLQHEARGRSGDDRASLGVALDSIDHMETIVQDLLNFSRPAPMQFRIQPLGTIIDESLAMIQLRTRSRRIVLTKNIEAGLPLLSLDAPHFKEALINLFLNALQAIETNGSGTKEEQIGITAQKINLAATLRDFAPSRTAERNETGAGEENDEIILRKGTDCLRVTITDTGPGIEKEVMSRMFDPFFTTKVNGTGLGLPMVKRTINAHRGIIRVKNSPDGGAAFDIYLPLLPGI